MSVDIMQTISIVAFVLAGILAAVALILWFRLNVHGIIDDLSGKKAERQIRELREQNVQTQMADRKGRVIYDSPSERTTGKLASRKKKEPTSQLTVPLSKKTTESVYSKEETALLQGDDAAVLPDMEEGTTVLGDEEGKTVPAQDATVLQNGYRLVLNEIVVHTKERI